MYVKSRPTANSVVSYLIAESPDRSLTHADLSATTTLRCRTLRVFSSPKECAALRLIPLRYERNMKLLGNVYNRLVATSCMLLILRELCPYRPTQSSAAFSKCEKKQRPPRWNEYAQWNEQRFIETGTGVHRQADSIWDNPLTKPAIQSTVLGYCYLSVYHALY